MYPLPFRQPIKALEIFKRPSGKIQNGFQHYQRRKPVFEDTLMMAFSADALRFTFLRTDSIVRMVAMVDETKSNMLQANTNHNSPV